MVEWKRPATIGVLSLLALLGATTVHSEVSTNASDSNVHFLVIEEVPLGSHTEDPNPVGTVWIPLRTIPQSWLLNPDGGPRGDRRPDSARLASHSPAAVWAYVPGPSSDIAFAEWNGAGWLPTEFLTDGQGWNWDPRIHIASDDTIQVVWWEQTAPARVLLRSRPAGSTTWGPLVPVSGPLESGRRPSVVAIDDTVWVAYERDSALPGVAQEVVVAVRQGAGAFARLVVAETTETDALEVSIHHEEGHLWLGWRQDEDAFVHIERIGSVWSPPVVHLWSDYTWLGLEQIRRVVRSEVLLPK